MKRITALFLSLMLLCAPLSSFATTSLTTEDVLEAIIEGVAEAINGESDGMTATLTSPAGESVAVGISNAENGFAAHYAQHDFTLLLTEQLVCLLNGTDAASVDAEALLTFLLQAASGGQAIPSLTEDDLQLLANAGMQLLNSLTSSDCFSFFSTGNLMNLHIDVDKLVHQLDEQLPQVLSTDAVRMDALFTKLTPYLFGQTVTLEQFIAMWQQLGLKNVQTGLTLDAVISVSAGGVTLIASCMGWNIKLEVDDAGLSFAFTSPEGVVYAFDTNDLLTVASILSSVPSAITAEAFTIEQTTSDKVLSNGRTRAGAIVTTHIKTDLALVMRDLVGGLKNAISANSLTVDALLKKYQPWIDLFTAPSVDAQGNVIQPAALTAKALVNMLDGLRFTSSIPGEATIVVDQYYETCTVDGYLAEMLFEADLGLSGGLSSIDAAIRVPGRYEFFELTLTGISYYSNHFQYTLACTEDLGGFHAITFSTYAPSYNKDVFAITTDTDAFHLSYDYDRTSERIDLKLGSFLLEFSHNSRTQPDTALHASWPGGFVNLVVSNSGMELDSNYLGFSFTETRNVIRAEGYINEYVSLMRPSSFAFMLDNENEILTLSILPYNSGNTHITYRTGKLSILSNEEELVIADTRTGTGAQNITQMTFDGEPMLTFVSDVAADGDVIIHMYQGAATAGECWLLTFDFDAAAMTIPASAVSVTPAEFINRLNSVLTPPAAAPEAAENPEIPESSVPSAP